MLIVEGIKVSHPNDAAKIERFGFYERCFDAISTVLCRFLKIGVKVSGRNSCFNLLS